MPCVRFHLHPDIMVEPTENGHLLHSEEESWLFQSDGQVRVEESVYLGQGRRIKTLQLVLTPPAPPLDESAAVPAPEPDAAPAEEETTPAQQAALPETAQEQPATVASAADALSIMAEETSPLADPLPAAEPVEPAPTTAPEPKPAATGHPALLHSMIGQPPPKPIHWALTLISE